MISIKPNRCGYTGYKCDPSMISELDPVFRTGMSADPSLQNSSPDIITVGPTGTALINNYRNIPESFDGFRTDSVPVLKFTVSPVNGGIIENCGITQSSEFGWMYGLGDGGNAVVSIVTEPGNEGKALGANSIPDTKTISAWNAITFGGAAVDFGTSSATATFYPGLLEPMPETGLTDVSVSALSELDVNMDGLAIPFALLGKWKTMIEMQVASIAYFVAEAQNDPLSLQVQPDEVGCWFGLKLRLAAGSMIYRKPRTRDALPPLISLESAGPVLNVSGYRGKNVIESRGSYPVREYRLTNTTAYLSTGHLAFYVRMRLEVEMKHGMIMLSRPAFSNVDVLTYKEEPDGGPTDLKPMDGESNVKITKEFPEDTSLYRYVCLGNVNRLERKIGKDTYYIVVLQPVTDCTINYRLTDVFNSGMESQETIDTIPGLKAIVEAVANSDTEVIPTNDRVEFHAACPNHIPCSTNCLRIVRSRKPSDDGN